MSYINPRCVHKVNPHDRACGTCGEPVEIVDETHEVRDAPTVQDAATATGTYRAEISRQQPGCLIFLIDQSGSMSRRIAGGEQQKKHAILS